VVQPWWRLGWAESGAVAGLLLLPALYLSTVHLHRADTAPAGYVATVGYHAGSTVIAAVAGLLLTVLVALHLAGLRRWASQWRPATADSCTAVGAVGVLGLGIGFLAAIVAAYGARHGWGVDPVKAMGAVAENAAAVLLAALAAPAYLVMRLGLDEHVLPVRLGYAAAVAFGALLLIGVLQPGLATWPALLWLVVSGVALAMRREPADEAPADLATDVPTDAPGGPADAPVAAPEG